MRAIGVAAIAALAGATGVLVAGAVLDEMAVEPTSVATFATSRGATSPAGAHLAPPEASAAG